MNEATYLCQCVCMSECRHHMQCLVIGIDEQHPHPPKHVSWDYDSGLLHRWVGKGTGKCTISKEDT